MFENNWVAERLVQDHQHQAMEKAERARHVQDAKQVLKLGKGKRLFAKLRAEMSNL